MNQYLFAYIHYTCKPEFVTHEQNIIRYSNEYTTRALRKKDIDTHLIKSHSSNNFSWSFHAQNDEKTGSIILKNNSTRFYLKRTSVTLKFRKNYDLGGTFLSLTLCLSLRTVYLRPESFFFHKSTRNEVHLGAFNWMVHPEGSKERYISRLKWAHRQW